MRYEFPSRAGVSPPFCIVSHCNALLTGTVAYRGLPAGLYRADEK